jgi:RNA polymerase sigma factor (sigma-70 family)
MAAEPLSKVLAHLRRVLDRQGVAGETDAELLTRYLRRHDEAAFEALVRRHGPMVHGVCRRVLRHEADADDAFQATFLVLIRKVSSLRAPGLLGNWLYGVAYRTALEAKRAAARRRAKEATMTARTQVPREAGFELRDVLDQELERLPDKYRAVVVLCDLQGKTRKEAARQLGWPEGTVAGRLARARALLARRLAKHGLALSSTAVAAALAETASASVPAPLVALTVKIATALAAQQAAAAGLISANVHALAEGVLKTMLWNKLKTITIVVLTACGVGLGTGSVYYRSAAAQADQLQSAAKDPPAANPSEVDKLRQELQELRDKMTALEKRLGVTPEPPEVLYRGKPASFWLKQLKDKDMAFRSDALTALGAIGQEDRSVVPALVAALKDPEPGLGRQAISALAHCGPHSPPIARAVAEALHRGVPVADRGFGGAGGSDRGGFGAASDYGRGNPRSNSYSGIANQLKKIDPKGQVFVPFFVKEAISDDLEARQRAIELLGGFGPQAKPAVETLIDLLKDPKVHQQALAALPLIDRKAALPFLIDALKSLDENERRLACNALAQYGPEGKAAIPSLLLVANSDNNGFPVFRRLAAQAVWNIDPEAAAKADLPRYPGGPGVGGGAGRGGKKGKQ